MLFKPNLLFRNFDVQGSTDRLLVYALLYVAACLKKIVKKPKVEAEKLLFSYALENFPLPGDAKFPLGGLCSAPASKADAGTLLTYDSICFKLFIGDSRGYIAHT
jgi:actin related protein 2/3 complex subunit 3